MDTEHYAWCIRALETSLQQLYCDNRNKTAHDYGIGFAEETLKLLPDFVAVRDNPSDMELTTLIQSAP